MTIRKTQRFVLLTITGLVIFLVDNHVFAGPINDTGAKCEKQLSEGNVTLTFPMSGERLNLSLYAITLYKDDVLILICTKSADRPFSCDNEANYTVTIEGDKFILRPRTHEGSMGLFRLNPPTQKVICNFTTEAGKTDGTTTETTNEAEEDAIKQRTAESVGVTFVCTAVFMTLALVVLSRLRRRFRNHSNTCSCPCTGSGSRGTHQLDTTQKKDFLMKNPQAGQQHSDKQAEEPQEAAE